jgi:hypothetical protein
MTLSGGRAIAAVSLALLLPAPLLYSAWVPSAWAQSTHDAPAMDPPSSLDLTPEEVSHLKTAVAAHDYLGAEKLLLNSIEQDPHALRAGPLLAYLGSVYFLNHDYWNAAIAWKKSDAIRPLGPRPSVLVGHGVHPDRAFGLGAHGARIPFRTRHEKRALPLLAWAPRLRRSTLPRGDPSLSTSHCPRPNHGACVRQPWALLLLPKREWTCGQEFRHCHCARPRASFGVALFESRCGAKVCGPHTRGGNRSAGSSAAGPSARGGTLPAGERPSGAGSA